MNFNPDPINKLKKLYSLHPVVLFDNRAVTSTQIHKHLGMMLDTYLSYEHHIKSILIKAKKTIGLLRKFQLMLQRQVLN